MAGLLKKITGLVRLDVSDSPHEPESDVKKLEDQLQGDQIEEVILQEENELVGLARKMIKWKPGKPLVEAPPANQWKWPI
ncbi:NADH dehydrogenase [ubiquinone] 1 alpha subcomplex subunit 5-like isoform X2 [Tupaia chinensis]|uniref:NADH dehydrogenase [ubiquinone] 1 alpha subcomplex subunit 5-like isoform X2 n=1 Tax=Tupaia chinensis TaxID=246437 RepID=UPI0003C91240|nr:NADH dehydrogenase [ubiquinone] 1 alpha subcomplex subunit 5-like isoform X2 [Tupaia chinensis]